MQILGKTIATLHALIGNSYILFHIRLRTVGFIRDTDDIGAVGQKIDIFAKLLYSCKKNASTLSSSQFLTQFLTCLYIYDCFITYELLGIYELCRQLVVQVCAICYQYDGRACQMATAHQHTS